MADQILLVVGELGHRPLARIFVEQEHGVVAKAVLTAWGRRETAAALAEEDPFSHSVDKRDRADVAQFTADGRLGHEFAEILLVGRVLTRETGGTHPRATSERG